MRSFSCSGSDAAVSAATATLTHIIDTLIRVYLYTHAHASTHLLVEFAKTPGYFSRVGLLMLFELFVAAHRPRCSTHTRVMCVRDNSAIRHATTACINAQVIELLFKLAVLLGALVYLCIRVAACATQRLSGSTSQEAMAATQRLSILLRTC